MFAKPFRVKSSSQMKGSDKKKLKGDLKKKFPAFTDDILGTLLPNKDEVVVTKVYTFNGDSLLVYYRDKNPVFFELEKDKVVFPTVYTLWQYPDLLTCFPTHPPVVKKLANGADLMLPGMVVDHSLGDKTYGKLKKGDVLGVNLTDNKAPVAVGTAALSSEDMYMAGNRGKGIHIVHMFGDHLWSTGTKQPLPDLGVPDGLAFLEKQEEHDVNDDDEDDDAEEDPENADEDIVTTESVDATSPETVTTELETLNIENKEQCEEEEKPDNRSPQEIMDELVTNAFLQALKTTAKKVELPMLTSNFYRVHMVPASAKPLDLKKSSFKKLGKFLAHMQKAGIIKVKELQKGVESVTEINYAHEMVKRFVVEKREPVEPVEEPEVLPCDQPYEPPVIKELHTVSAAVGPLFKLLGHGKGKGFTTAEVRNVLREYVAQNELQNGSKVKMDPVLAGIVLGKGENDVVEMKWDDLTSRLVAKMSSGYALQFRDGSTEVHKGKLESIEMSVATRSGNKKVTLIHNLEVFKIDPNEFAHKCQVGVAASTSVHPAANKKTGAEVLVQGNQVAFASKLLLNEYRIPKKFILGMEKAVKKR